MQYYGVVQLGSPGQNTTMCFDTGSALVWTPADTFAGVDMTAQMQNKFATNASDSFQAGLCWLAFLRPTLFSGEHSIFGSQLRQYPALRQIIARNFSEKYMSGGVVGLLASDSMKVGDLAVNNASIGLATQASVNLTGASCDGIFVRASIPLPIQCKTLCRDKVSSPRVLSQGICLCSVGIGAPWSGTVWPTSVLQDAVREGEEDIEHADV